MNKGFLFATSSRKIKSHVVESQITLLVWPCLSLTEKQRTINHMIIFNDSISEKKKTIAEAIKFLGILKKYVSKKNIYFCLKKKSNVLLNKKVIFVFYMIFKLGFITQIIYCIIHRCLYSLFILFLFSYISFLL